MKTSKQNQNFRYMKAPIEFDDLKKGVQISSVSSTNPSDLKKIRDREKWNNIKDIGEVNLIRFRNVKHIFKNDIR